MIFAQHLGNLSTNKENNFIMKIFLLTTICFVFAIALQAQPAIQFDESTHDFGEVMEADGPISHKFEFTNTGTAPVVINNVKASCGCTTPGWTRDPVMPGERGYIQAQYNPANRPGSFRKSLTLSSNAGSSIAYIAGQVTPKPKTLAESLPTQLGSMRVRTRALNMGTIKNNAVTVKKHDIYNESDIPLSLMKSTAPNHIKVSFEPETIEPQGSGKIVISYDPTQIESLGYSQNPITLETNEAADALKNMSVSVTVMEYFAPMTAEERDSSPKLNLESKVVEFGSAKAGEPVLAEFTFTNTGKQDLNIRDIKTNCDCTEASTDNSTVKPGESGKVMVTFDTDGKKGMQHQQITIFSNDPRNSMQSMALRGSVNAD